MKQSVVVTIDEEDALFMRKPRTAQQWKKLAQIEKGVFICSINYRLCIHLLVAESKPALTIDISDDEDSPRARKYKKKAKVDKPLPSWTKKKQITSLCVFDSCLFISS